MWFNQYDIISSRLFSLESFTMRGDYEALIFERSLGGNFLWVSSNVQLEIDFVAPVLLDE